MSCLRISLGDIRSQDGVALVVALLVFAICAGVLVALQRDFDLSYRRGLNSFVAEQSWAYLRGAEDLASLALTLDYDADLASETSRDDLNEIWAQQATPYALDEGGWMFGSLTDLQGRFNLNSLGDPAAAGTSSYSPAQQTFIRLLQALESAELDQFAAIAVTEAVADWIDADDEPRLNGAESAYYVSLQPSYRPGNRPMMSVSELLAVATMTPEIFQALRPHVTVWPQVPAAINIHTASQSVLQALNVDGNLQPLSRSEGESLVQLREGAGFTSLEEFLQLAVFSGESNSGIATLLTESSSYFLLASRVEIADREQRLYSVLRRQAREIDVLQRINASLYDMPNPAAENSQ
ncbi:MAG: general secretion pathway protein K [Glaciecola sp.]|jgi:general secretion pathway protein K|uniref:type II secretion system minor pseudopilin GspK n=1 Tax=Congregibacter sp. TaxID=2744308 RepID=UPI0039E2298C